MSCQKIQSLYLWPFVNTVNTWRLAHYLFIEGFCFVCFIFLFYFLFLWNTLSDNHCFIWSLLFFSFVRLGIIMVTRMWCYVFIYLIWKKYKYTYLYWALGSFYFLCPRAGYTVHLRYYYYYYYILIRAII